ncbi:MAG: hypothetical protein WBE37_05795 [Bryobacteraceae bacterium]
MAVNVAAFGCAYAGASASSSHIQFRIHFSLKAQKVRRAPQNMPGTTSAPLSVLREFLKSAKGAARTAKQTKNQFRAALRFARVL